MSKKFLIFVGALNLTLSAQAQVITARATEMNYNYLFGAGAQGTSDTLELEDFALELSDFHQMTGSGNDAGVLNGNAWTAGFATDIYQEFQVDGQLTDFTGISANAYSDISCFATGPGSALNFSANPGNRIILNFDVVSSLDYTLVGNVSAAEGENGIGTFVALQRFDGIVWQQVHTTLFLPGNEGDFNYSGTLNAGNYRMISALGITASGSQSLVSTYNYDLQVVPEPVTLAFAAPLLLALKRRKKRV